uniref:TLC domain-containing protein n=1 Tax=Pseudonaja textilis TaxID=8673 RepID=A0A670YXY6_PSETE
HFKKNFYWKEEVSGLAKQCDLQPRQIERWFRYRLNQNRPGLTKKFCEASWRSVHSLTYLFMTLAVLYDVSNWDYMTPFLFIYALQPLHPSLYVYYLLQFSSYLTLVISMPFDVKQKDFNVMIVHHVISMLLIGFSYCVNFIPIGSLVLILHGAPDTPLYAAKVFNYLKWQKTCNTLFIIFSVVFLFNRAIFFPYKILYSTIYHFAETHELYFYYFFNALLMLVYVLNVCWSYTIILMLYRFLIHGKVRTPLCVPFFGLPDTEEVKNGTHGSKTLYFSLFSSSKLRCVLWSGACYSPKNMVLSFNPAARLFLFHVE